MSGTRVVLCSLSLALAVSCRDSGPPAATPALGREKRALNGSPLDTVADYVLGQPNLSTTGYNWARASGTNEPWGVAADLSGRLETDGTPSRRVYVADTSNHRVLMWRNADALADGQDADFIVGGQVSDVSSDGAPPGCIAPTPSALCHPRAAATDAQGNLYVADSWNHRVLIYDWPVTDGVPDRVLGQGGDFYKNTCASGASGLCNPAALAIDGPSGALFVADADNHRVLRFVAPRTNPAAQAAFGQVNLTANQPSAVSASTLNSPAGLAFDRSRSTARLWVADSSNNRVIAFDDPLTLGSGASANTQKIIGQTSPTTNACDVTTTLQNICRPQQLVVDAEGNLFAAEQGPPQGLNEDRQRVLEFDAPFAAAAGGAGDVTADRVFGRAQRLVFGYSGTCEAVSATKLCQPGGVALDAAGRLLIADTSNHRVVRFDSPMVAQPASDRPADRVLGQPNLTENAVNRVDPWGLNAPTGVALDRTVIPHRLYVADTGNNRVLGWRDAWAFQDGAPADLVIGQTSPWDRSCPFAPNRSPSPSATRLCEPRQLTVDGAGNLYVVDSGHARVLMFPRPFDPANPSPPAATRVWGPADLNTSGKSLGCSSVNATQFCDPSAVAVDAQGWVYVSDRTWNRVLGFPPGQTTATRVFGQFGSFTSNASSPTGPRSLYFPTGLAVDPAGRLLVSDTGNRRVVRYPTPQAAGGDVADLALGAPDLSTPGNFAPDHIAANSGALFAAFQPTGQMWYTASAGPVLEYALPGSEAGPQLRTFPAIATFGTSDEEGWWTPGYCRATPYFLCFATGLAADDAGTLFVADAYTHRVAIYLGNNPARAVHPYITPDPPKVGDALQAHYTPDDPEGQPESGTLIAWFRDGVQQSAYDNLKTLPTTALTKKNEVWHFVVRAGDGLYPGLAATSPSVTVVNAPPLATNVRITPAEPSRETGLTVAWDYSDADLDPPGAPLVTWIKNGVATALSGTTVPGSAVARNETWSVQVRAFDGTIYGPPGTAANPVTIGNTLPRVDSAAITPAQPTSADSLRADFETFDLDGDPVTGLVTWFRNGVPVPPLKSADPARLTLPGPFVWKDQWRFSVVPADHAGEGAERISQIVEIGSTAPSAGNLRFSPAQPTSAAPLRAVWDFVSVDGLPDRSTLRWFLDQDPRPDLDGVNPLPVTELRRGQLWSFTVEPADGQRTGLLQTSATVRIANAPPTGAAASISPSPALTGQELTARYDFDDADLDADESIPIWYRNGVEHSRGRTVPGAEVHKNEVWTFRVVLSDGYPQQGPTLDAPPLTIQNSAPAATDPHITPAAPRKADALQANYTFEDRDGDTDHTSAIAWKMDGNAVPDLNGQRTVPSARLAKGQRWTFTATPHDGSAAGSPTTAPEVRVLNTAPSASALALTPAAPIAGEPLAADYRFDDVDGDADTSQTTIAWYRNGQLFGTGRTVAAGTLRRGEFWYFVVTPHDGTDAGAPVALEAVKVGNRAPSADGLQVLPAAPRVSTPLSASYHFSDPDGDSEATSQTVITWYLNGQRFGTGSGVPASALRKGQSWHFTVEPSDWLAFGPLVSSEPVTILNSPPSVSAGSDQLEVQPDALTATKVIHLAGSASDDDGDLLTPIEWWEAGDPPVLRANGLSADVELGVGHHELLLRVGDGEATAEDSMTVTVADQALELSVDPLRTVKPGRIALGPSFLGLIDPLERAVTYRWEQRSGETVQVEQADPGSPEAFIFATRAGDYELELTASTSTNHASERTVIRVEDLAPFAGLEGRFVLRKGQAMTVSAPESADPNGGALTWQWTASAGLDLQGATSAEPRIAAGADGTYTLTLVVHDGAQESAPAVAQVLVIDPAVAHAPVPVPGPDRSVRLGDEARLDGAASYDLDGEVLRYRWSLVEFRPAGGAEPAEAPADVPRVSFEPGFALTPPAAGDYLFALAVRDPGESGAEARVTLHVYDPLVERNRMPIPHAGADGRQVQLRDTVELDASRSADPEKQPLRYRWRQTWGPTVTLDDAEATRPVFSATQPGLLRFELSVSDRVDEATRERVWSAPASVSLYILKDGNLQPTSNAGAGRRVRLDASAALDASASHDPDGAPLPLRFRWTQRAGAPVPLSDWFSPTPSLFAAGPGRYAFAVSAFDGQVPGVPSEVEMVVTTHGEDNQPPTAAIAAPEQIAAGEAVPLDGSASRDADPLDRLAFRWDVVGFPGAQPPELDDPTSPAPRFTAAAAGTYSLRLVVSDGDLRSAPAYAFVKAGDEGPVACGCSSGPAGPAALLAAAAALLPWRRRRAPLALLLAAALAVSGCREPARTAADAPAALGSSSQKLLPPLDVDPDGVLGQDDFEHASANRVDGAGLHGVQDVAVDPRPAYPHVYVLDGGNNRVLGWSRYADFAAGRTADLAIGQASLGDFSRSTSAAWAPPECGAPQRGNLCAPSDLALDEDGNLYVADRGYNRVLRFDRPFETDRFPDRVFGQTGYLTNARGTALTGLDRPKGVAAGGGWLYVADTENNRLLRYAVAQTAVPPVAELMYGPGLSASAVNWPAGLSLDLAASPPRLFVADYGNSRVLEIRNPGATPVPAASAALGQDDFTSGSCNKSCWFDDWCWADVCAGAGFGSLCFPTQVHAQAGRVWVSDGAAGGGCGGASLNHRLAGWAYGAAAPDKVIGQAGWGQADCNRGGAPSARTVCSPGGAATAPDGALLLADSGNLRVLRYPVSALAASVDAAADFAMGQLRLTESYPDSMDAQSLNGPLAVAVDRTSTPNHVYVADTNNHRVLGWADETQRAWGRPADLVLGQTAPDTALSGLAQNRLNRPSGLAVAPNGDLYVADTGNHRVLRFPRPFAGENGANANLVLGQTGYTSGACNRGTSTPAPDKLCSPRSLAIDGAGNLFVADYSNQRVVLYLAGQLSATRAYGQSGLSLKADTGCTAPSASTVCFPEGVALDDQGRLYIADGGYRVDGTPNDPPRPNRVIGFASPLADSTATIVLGRANLTSPPSTFEGFIRLKGLAAAGADLYVMHESAGNVLDRIRDPTGVKQVVQRFEYFLKDSRSADVSAIGNLYAADAGAHRVLMFLANRPPRALGLSIAPTSPLGGDALTAGWAFNDPDGQPPGASTVRWYLNGTRVPAHDGLNPLPAGVVRKGERWHFDVAVSDGMEWSPAVESDPVLVGNKPPSAAVSVRATTTHSASGITTLDGLTADPVGADPDGDLVTFPRVEWLKDNVAQPQYDGLLALPAAATGRNETWLVRVTPFDDSALGAPATASASIINLPPTAANARVEPASPLSTERLVARYDWSDPDVKDREAASRISWFKNADTAPSASGAELTLPLTAGDRWAFAVEPGDGQTWGTPLRSAAVTVRASPPTASAVSVAPAKPTSSDTLTANYTYGSVDHYAERNTTIAWQRNGAGTAYNGRTVPPTALAIGERWSFTVTPCDDHGACGTPQTSAEVLVGNSPPSVAAPAGSTAPFIAPSAPLGGATLTAVYAFADKDQDPDRSRLTWYRNDQQAGTGESPDPALVRHFDTWYFTVQAYDGTAVGNTLTSLPVSIGNSPPSVSAVAVGPPQPRVTAPLEVSYLFEDDDQDAENGTEYAWTAPGATPVTTRQLPATALRKGQVWTATVRPKDGRDFGAAVSSATVTILNSAPTAIALSIEPAAPISGDALSASWTFSDADPGDASSPQTQVRWLRNGQDAGITGPSVAAGLVAKGERWSFAVRAHDGSEFGTEVVSQPVVIDNHAPSATQLALTPAAPTAASTLTASYLFADPDLDGERDSTIRWFARGVEQPGLMNLRTISRAQGADLRKNEDWFFRVTPNDGYTAGVEAQGPTVRIGNQPPAADAGPDRTVAATALATPVTLDASASSDPDLATGAGVEVLDYVWQELVDGAPGPGLGGQSAVMPLSIGTHTIRLTVRDNSQAVSQDEVVITVAVEDLVLDIPSLTEQPPGHVRLRARVVDKLGRDLELIRWEQRSGPETVTLIGPDTLEPSFFTRAAGDYTFELTVRTDAALSIPSTATRSTTVHVQDAPPFAAAFPTSLVVPIGEPALLDARESADPNGTPLTYAWELVEGDPRAEILEPSQQVTSLLPPSEGSYLARLTVSDGAQESAETPASLVRVLAIDRRGADRMPVAKAKADPYGEVGAPVVLDASQSYDLDGDELEYVWRQYTQVGDDVPAVSLEQSGASARFVPRQSGTYRFALEIRAAGQTSAEDLVQVVVADGQINGRPVASLVVARLVDGAAAPLGDGPIQPRDRLVLDGSASFDPDANDLAFDFLQTRGTPVTLERLDDTRRAFTVLGTGLHRFQLVVHETEGSPYASDPIEVAIQVVEGGNRPPSVNAGGDLLEPHLIGTELQLRGSARDADGDELAWRWMQIEGAPVPLLEYDTAEPRFTPKAVGRYTFQAVVLDGQVASLPDEVSVVVKTHGAVNATPVAVIAAPATTPAGVEITLDGSQSADPDALDRLKYRWEVVGLPTGEQPTLAAPAGASTTFVAKAPGDYAVRLSVTDGELWSAPVFAQITVTGGAPEAGACGCATGAGAPLAAFALLAWAALRRRH